jgi:cytoskeleton protein RodZ
MLGSTSADHDRVDPAEALLREVGAQLRQVRLERGEDLTDVAGYLRIKSSYLFGIEQGDLSGLPGRTYALGFLRTYADYLGFDGEDLIARIKSSVGDLADRTRLRIRTPMPENRLPKTPIVVISLAVVVGIYLGSSYVNRNARTVMDTVAEVPGDLRGGATEALPEDPGSRSPGSAVSSTETAAAADGASDASKGVESAEAVASGQGDATSAARPVESTVATTAADRLPEDAREGLPGQVAPQTGPPVDDQMAQGRRDALTVQPAAGGGEIGPAPTVRRLSTAEAVPAPPAMDASPQAAVDRPEAAASAAAERPDDGADANKARRAVALLLDSAAQGADGGPRVFEMANIDARVILRAREPTWIQVSSPAGDYTFTRTLEPGEAVLVPDRPDLELWTGNAPGLEILVDGTPVALPRGRVVRRNVSLDPARLLADQPR